MTVFDIAQQISSYEECRDETISRKTIGRVLEAGRHAPSPKGTHTLHFVVVESNETKEMISTLLNDKRIEKSPTVIIVLSDINRMARRVGETESGYASSSEVACSVQNMRLVAQENDISSCWFSGFDEDVLREKLNAPEGKVPMAVVSFAYTDNPVPLKSRFGMGQICYYERYGKKISTLFDNMEWKGVNEESRIYSKKVKGFRDKVARLLRKDL